ncbi:MAG: hypothetical protein GX621_01185, partial [Pirellulaceae bacterium]|nr:hypothetical protein [Pirellulaceae bacterium]
MNRRPCVANGCFFTRRRSTLLGFKAADGRRAPGLSLMAAWMGILGMLFGAAGMEPACGLPPQEGPGGPTVLSCHNPNTNQPEGDDPPPEECIDEAYVSLATPLVESAAATRAPILLRRGSVIERVTDLALPGPIFGWSHTRTYDSALDTGVPNDELSADNGQRWTGGPHSLYLKQVVKQVGYDIEVYTSASHKRTFTYSDGTTFTAPAGVDATLEKLVGQAFDPASDGIDDYEPTLFKLTLNATGDVYFFHGFDSSVLHADAGRLKERTNRHYLAEGKKGVVYTYDAFVYVPDDFDPDPMDPAQYIVNPAPRGLIQTITTAEPQSHCILYTHSVTSGSVDLLKKIQVFAAGADPENDEPILEAEYTYVDSAPGAHADCGSTGDLIQVRVSHLASDGQTRIDRYTQYRYHKAGGTAGRQHQLKMVLEPDAVERAVTGTLGADDPDDLLAMENSAVDAFATRTFTYYVDNDTNTNNSITTPWGSQDLDSWYAGDGGTSDVSEYDTTLQIGRVKTETIRGACGSCGGSGSGVTHTYFYIKINSASIDPNTVVDLIVEDTQDSSTTPVAVRRTIYGLNHMGQQLRRVILANPASLSAGISCESVTLNTNYQIEERRKPSAHWVTANTGDHSVTKFLNPTADAWANDSSTLHDSLGEIVVYDYDNGKLPKNVFSKKGRTGPQHLVAATDYIEKDHVTATYTYSTPTAEEDREDDGVKTEYAYTYHDATAPAVGYNVKTKTTTLPTIASDENGSGDATVLLEYYDEVGRLRWTRDGEGVLTYYSYHPYNGRLSYKMVDVGGQSLPADIQYGDGSGPGQSDAKWVRWGSAALPADFGNLPQSGLCLVTRHEFDDQGRVALSVEPDGARRYTVYSYDATKDCNVAYRFSYGATASNNPVLPIQVSETDAAGRPVQTYAVAPNNKLPSGSGVPTGIGSVSQGDYVSLTKYAYHDTSGSPLYVDRYHVIPSSGNGTVGTNFYSTRYIDDTQGRRAATVQYVESGQYQVSVNEYDFLGRVKATYRGVTDTEPVDFDGNDGIHDPSGYKVPGNGAIARVSATEYDADGRVTKQKSFFDAANPTHHVGTNFHYTYRGHLRGTARFHNTSSETFFGPYPVQDVDWQGRVTASAVYTSAPGTWPTDYTAYTGETSGRSQLSQTDYDKLGRVYRTRRYADGSANHFLTDYYYDRNGRRVATVPAYQAATETAFDAAGRAYQTRVVKALAATKYSSGAFVYRAPTPDPDLDEMEGGNDLVIEMNHTVFDAASRAIESHAFEMNYTDPTADDGDDTGIDLSNNDDYVRSTVYRWYDAAGRLDTVANYGSGDATAGPGDWKYAAVPDRPTTIPTASSETVLVTKYDYDEASGRLATVASPAGTAASPSSTATKTYYDALGRTTYTVENHVDFSPPSSGVGGGNNNDQDKVTHFVYNGLGNITQLVAMNPTTGNQTTEYEYADQYNAALVTTTTYPDDGEVAVSYYLDSSVKTRTDQRGVILTHVYDPQRRLSHQGATTLPAGVNDSIKSIKRTYDALGRVERITSWSGSDATGT